MSIENVIEASATRGEQRRPRRSQQSLRWAVARLIALWFPIAAVLAFALWNALFYTLAPWDHRDNGPPELDALPSQLLFAALLITAGRVEIARLSATGAPAVSLRIYWTLTTLLMGLGVAALWRLASIQPLLQ